jgi:hypothetical protein
MKSSSEGVWRPRRIAIVLLVAVALAGGLPGPDRAFVSEFIGGASDLEITTFSTLPHLVTVGDVLVRIGAASGVGFDRVEVRLNGADVTASFRPETGGGALLGFLVGLRAGENDYSFVGTWSPLPRPAGGEFPRRQNRSGSA